MALWLTLAIAFTCLGGFASPSRLPPCKEYEDLIEELNNISRHHPNDESLCNGSMVWSLNLTVGMQYCAVREALKNISNCSAIRRTQKILETFCGHRHMPRQAYSMLRQDTKIQVHEFITKLRIHLKKMFREQGNLKTVCRESQRLQ